MNIENELKLKIAYKTDVGDKTMLVNAEDICTNGVIDESKVISIAAGNEVENNLAILNPVVLYANK
ncbi:hypothetical protein SE27_09710 [Acinetobacter harbinensis]|uniref:hypothetical protein n=1 Tax=Acinetobacter harbinensis TaxID=1353941 RepID=UPI00057D3C5C|nr:hypothetical protein [Acinetobacter harbinensis]KWQ05499.1 hypothetical protein SE27_09710 [Acinetobacter harbinensis]